MSFFHNGAEQLHLSESSDTASIAVLNTNTTVDHKRVDSSNGPAVRLRAVVVELFEDRFNHLAGLIDNGVEFLVVGRHPE